MWYYDKVLVIEDLLDTARAICMLWIVGFWHIGINHDMFMPWIESITIGTLSVFTFISGYFLGGNLKTNKDIRIFYIKRIKRFYPLFLLSCISLYMLHVINGNINYISSVQQLVLAVLGLACFVRPAPLTIWYFVMIMFFYLVTPIITRRNKLKTKVIVASILYVILILSYIFGGTDIRIILYFPIYVLGLVCHEVKISNIFNFKILFIAILVSIITVLLYSFRTDIIFTQLLAGISLMAFIMEISKLLTNEYTYKMFTFVSYASMCAYLFHRQFFACVRGVFGDVSWLMIYVIILPVFIIGCYVVQRVYDWFIYKFFKFST